MTLGAVQNKQVGFVGSGW